MPAGPLRFVTSLCCLAAVIAASLTTAIGASDEVNSQKSEFEQAVERGIARNGNLQDELEQRRYEIATSRDIAAFGRAISHLQSLPSYEDKDWSALLRLLRLANSSLSNTENPNPRDLRLLLSTNADADLVRLAEKLGQIPASRIRDACLLDTLELLARCGTSASNECVLKHAKSNAAIDESGWYAVFEIYLEQDREFCQRLLRELSNPLPSGYIAAAYLKMCNQLAMSQSDFVHPFNNEQGLQRMTELISVRFQCYLYQIEACATEQIAPEYAEKFFNAIIARNMPTYSPMAAVRAAERGLPLGLQTLHAMCSDLLHQRVAREHLKALGRTDLIPEAPLTREFIARSEFLQSLAAGSWAYVLPDYARNVQVDVVAERLWTLPGETEARDILLLRYKAETDDPLNPLIDLAFFHDRLHQMPSKYRELSDENLIAAYCGSRILDDFGERFNSAPERLPAGLNKGIRFLHDWTILRPSDIVKYANENEGTSLIAVAAAEKDRQRGFVLFDGPRSEWYEAASFPWQFTSTDVLQIHVGRVILGLPHRIEALPGRQKHYSDEVLIGTYEEWLDDLNGGSLETRRRLLFGGNSLAPNQLAEHFDQYVDAVTRTRGEDRDAVAAATFEQILEVAEQLSEEDTRSAFERYCVLHQQFERYVTSLMTRDPEQAGELVQRLEIYHDEYGRRLPFAKVASKANLPALAIEYFEKAMVEDPGIRPLELAELWFRNGKQPEAIQLLKDVIRSASRKREVESWEELDKAREAIRILKALNPDMTDKRLRRDLSVPDYLLVE